MPTTARNSAAFYVRDEKSQGQPQFVALRSAPPIPASLSDSVWGTLLLLGSRRRWPDPIALVCILDLVRGLFHARDDSAIILFVPADGIEQEFSVVGPAIFQRLAADEIVRQFPNKAGHERIQRGRVFAMRAA